MNRIEHDFEKKIKDRVENHSLHISRLPKDTKEKFLNLANAEFCGDFGFTLKFLIDGLISTDSQELFVRVQELEQKVASLETLSMEMGDSKESEDGIRLANGKVIKKK